MNLVPTVYSGRPGCGKSTAMKHNVATKKVRHLYVAPRIDLIEREIAPDIEALLLQHEASGCSIHVFHSADGKKGGGVAKRAEDFAARYTNDDDHCVILICHATLLDLDLKRFRGWHLHLDEVVQNAVISFKIYSPLMKSGLESIFQLAAPVENTELRRLVCRSGVDLRAAMEDLLITEELRNLIKRALSGDVFADFHEISAVGERHCTCFAVWTLGSACAEFAQVEIAASDVEQSLMYIADQEPVPIDRIEVAASVSAAQIRVGYFALEPCNSHYWDEPNGQRNLELIAAHLSAIGVDYWTVNDKGKATMTALMPNGTYRAPQQEGANDLREMTSCAIFLSAKAQAHETCLGKLSTHLDKKTIRVAREGSLIRQFVTRGAIRCAAFSDVYRIFVYDLGQADALATWLQENGYTNVDTNHIDLEGFVEKERKKRGPKPCGITKAEREARKRTQGAERQRKYRSRQKAAKVLQGGAPLS